MTIDTAAWPKGRSGSRLAIALHGRGSNEQGLAWLADVLPADLDLACLRAPIPLDGGWTWFENRGLARPQEESMKQTVADILAWLDANASGYDQVSVIGMSAGTVTGGAVLMSAPERFASAVLFSGALPWDCGLDDSPGRFAGLRLLWSIDPNDGVMPQELVARSEAWLVEQSGADLTMEHPEGVGHAISPEMARSAATFLS